MEGKTGTWNPKPDLVRQRIKKDNSEAGLYGRVLEKQSRGQLIGGMKWKNHDQKL